MQPNGKCVAIMALTLAAIAAPGVATADMANAVLVDTAHEALGFVEFEQTPTGVLINVEVFALPPGWHGIHLHAVGSCTPDFKQATGHINPDAVPHGLRHPDGPDSGDLPNLHVPDSGWVKAEFFTARVSVAGSGDVPALLDEDGSAVIIHWCSCSGCVRRLRSASGAGGGSGAGVSDSICQEGRARLTAVLA